VLANAFAADRRFTVVLTNPRPNGVQADVRLAGAELAPQASLYTSTEEIKYQEREVSARGDTVSSIVLPPRSVSTLVCRKAYVGQPFDRTVSADSSPGVVYLSDLQWAAVSQAGKPGLLRDEIQGQDVNVAQDENLLRQWIVIQRTRYRKGLGMAAPAQVVYELGDKYELFQATVGMDDAAQGKSQPAVIFAVLVDGKKAFASGPLKPGQKPQAVSVPCTGAKQLTLIVAGAGDRGMHNLAAWGDARLVKRRPGPHHD
jgi:hypothetical protein